MKLLFVFVIIVVISTCFGQRHRQTEDSTQPRPSNPVISRGKTKFTVSNLDAENDFDIPKVIQAEPTRKSNHPRGKSESRQIASRRIDTKESKKPSVKNPTSELPRKVTEKPYEVEEIIDDIPQKIQDEYKFVPKMVESAVQREALQAAERIRQQTVKPRANSNRHNPESTISESRNGKSVKVIKRARTGTSERQRQRDAEITDKGNINKRQNPENTGSLELNNKRGPSVFIENEKDDAFRRQGRKVQSVNDSNTRGQARNNRRIDVEENLEFIDRKSQNTRSNRRGGKRFDMTEVLQKHSDVEVEIVEQKKKTIQRRTESTLSDDNKKKKIDILPQNLEIIDVNVQDVMPFMNMEIRKAGDTLDKHYTEAEAASSKQTETKVNFESEKSIVRSRSRYDESSKTNDGIELSRNTARSRNPEVRSRTSTRSESSNERSRNDNSRRRGNSNRQINTDITQQSSITEETKAVDKPPTTRNSRRGPTRPLDVSRSSTGRKIESQRPADQRSRGRTSSRDNRRTSTVTPDNEFSSTTRNSIRRANARRTTVKTPEPTTEENSVKDNKLGEEMKRDTAVTSSVQRTSSRRRTGAATTRSSTEENEEIDETDNYPEHFKALIKKKVTSKVPLSASSSTERSTLRSSSSFVTVSTGLGYSEEHLVTRGSEKVSVNLLAPVTTSVPLVDEKPIIASRFKPRSTIQRTPSTESDEIETSSRTTNLYRRLPSSRGSSLNSLRNYDKETPDTESLRRPVFPKRILPARVSTTETELDSNEVSNNVVNVDKITSSTAEITVSSSTSLPKYHSRFRTSTSRNDIPAKQEDEIIKPLIPRIKSFSPKPPRGIYTSRTTSTTTAEIEVVPSSTIGYRRKPNIPKNLEKLISTTSSPIGAKPGNLKYSSKYRNELLRANSLKPFTTPVYKPTIPFTSPKSAINDTNDRELDNEENVKIITIIPDTPSKLYSANLISEDSTTLVPSNVISSNVGSASIKTEMVTADFSTTSAPPIDAQPSSIVILSSPSPITTTYQSITSTISVPTTTLKELPSTTTDSDTETFTTQATNIELNSINIPLSTTDSILKTTTDYISSTSVFEQNESTTSEITTTPKQIKTTTPRQSIFGNLFNNLLNRVVGTTKNPKRSKSITFTSTTASTTTVDSSSYISSIDVSERFALAPDPALSLDNDDSHSSTTRSILTTDSNQNLESSTLGSILSLSLGISTTPSTNDLEESSTTIPDVTISTLSSNENPSTDQFVSESSTDFTTASGLTESIDLSIFTSDSSDVESSTLQNLVESEIPIISSRDAVSQTTATPTPTVIITQRARISLPPLTTASPPVSLPPCSYPSFPTAWAPPNYVPRFASRPSIANRSPAQSNNQRDYYVFGVLPNNTLVRKRPSILPESSFIIFGVFPNNTVVKKFPNGTILPDDNSVEIVSDFSTDPKPDDLASSNNKLTVTNEITANENQLDIDIEVGDNNALSSTIQQTIVSSTGAPVTTQSNILSLTTKKTNKASEPPPKLPSLLDILGPSTLQTIANNSTEVKSTTYVTLDVDPKDTINNKPELLSTLKQPEMTTNTVPVTTPLVHIVTPEKISTSTPSPTTTSTTSTPIPVTTTSTTPPVTQSFTVNTVSSAPIISSSVKTVRQDTTTSIPIPVTTTTTILPVTQSSTVNIVTSAPIISSSIKTVRQDTTVQPIPTTTPIQTTTIPTTTDKPVEISSLDPIEFITENVYTTSTPAPIKFTSIRSIGSTISTVVTTTNAPVETTSINVDLPVDVSTTEIPNPVFISSTTQNLITTTEFKTTSQKAIPTTTELKMTTQDNEDIEGTSIFSVVNSVQNTPSTKLSPVKSSSAVLDDTEFLNNLRKASAQITKPPKKEQEDLANRIIALAVGRSVQTTTTQKTINSSPSINLIEISDSIQSSSRTPKRVPSSPTNQELNDDIQLLKYLARLTNNNKRLTSTTTVASKSKQMVRDEELAKYLAQLVSPTKPPVISTTYGTSNEAILAALLKEQGIGPTTPRNSNRLQQDLQLAALLDQIVVTPKPKPTTRRPTTPRPTQPSLLQRLQEGLGNIIFSASSPVDSRLAAASRPAPPRQPPQTFEFDSISPEEIELSIPQNSLSSSTTRSIQSSQNSNSLSNGFKSNSRRPSQNGNVVETISVTQRPVNVRNRPQETESVQVRAQLVDAAINVTKAFSQFLGAAIQGAATSVQSFLNGGVQNLGSYFSRGSIVEG